MRTSYLFLTIFVFSLIFSACGLQYGNRIVSSVTPLDDTTCVPSVKPIVVFFDKEPIDFPYQKISFIEVNGNEYANNGQLIDRLKYHANNACANAVLFVDKQFADRESGIVGDESSKEVYTAPILTGIAAKIPDSVYNKHVDNINDTVYYGNVIRMMTMEKNEDSSSSAFYTILFLGLIVIGVIGLL